MLLYIQAVDTFKAPLSKEEYMEMLQVVNINNAGHMLGMCPIYVGMRVRLTVKISARHGIVQDAAGVVKGVKFHPNEFQGARDWRENSAHEAHESGYYRLRYAPRCVFVKFDDLEEDVGFGPGVVQVPMFRANWQFVAHELVAGFRMPAKRTVTRYQIPLVPERVRTVQTAQGLGMDAATMMLAKPANMSLDDWWLHLYVMLSRVRVAHRVLAYDLPPMEILERGPPEYIKEGVRRFEGMMPASRELARQRAREYGLLVGDGVDVAGGAGPAGSTTEGASVARSSGPVPPAPPAAPAPSVPSAATVPMASAVDAPRAPPAPAPARPPAPPPPRPPQAQLPRMDAIAREAAETRKAEILEPTGRDLCSDVYGFPAPEARWEALWSRPERNDGIPNLGNTCFVSASVQVLLRVAPLRAMVEQHAETCRLKERRCALCALSLQARVLFGARGAAGASRDSRPPLP